jgi:hypothetical protein
MEQIESGLRSTPSQSFGGGNQLTPNWQLGGMEGIPLKKRHSQYAKVGMAYDLNLPPGFDAQHVSMPDQKSALTSFGFYFPGLTTNSSSEKANWNSVSTHDHSEVIDDHEMNPNNQKMNPVLLFNTEMQDPNQVPAQLSIQQQSATTFGSDLFELVNVADIDRRLKERDPTPEDNTDNPKLDLVGEDREWNNWVVPTFTPTGTIPASKNQEEECNAAPLIRRGTSYQIYSQTSTFTGDSKRFNNLLQEYLNSGRIYEDGEFKPTSESIIGFGEKLSSSQTQFFKALEWRRPNEFFKGKQYGVFQDIQPNDILQGAVGDCYLLASLSSISEYKDRIKRIFLSKSPNNSGMYCMALCVTGIWEDIILDDMFPCTPNNTELAFNRSKSDELWVMLVEKAWAKVHGGYNNIDSGLIREALHDLTGAPAITFFTNEGSPENHWNNLREADAKKYIMACGTDNFNQSGNDDLDRVIGLAANHAYSLLSVFEIEKETNRVLSPYEPSSPYNDKVIKLRNPWGEGEWKGEWSDTSPKWEGNDLRTLLGASTKESQRYGEDGIFFMSFNDWMKYYSDYQICYFYDDYKYSAQKFNSSPSEPTHIGFQLNQEGEYYFTINQVSKRMFRTTDNYAYSQLTIFIARQEGDRFIYVGSTSKADREMWFKARCPPGRYVAYVLTPWRRRVNEFSFSIYGPGSAEIQLVDKSAVPSSFLECIMMEKATKDPKTLKNFAAQGEQDIFYKFENGSDSMGYFFFRNKSNDSQLTVTMDCIEMIDVEFIASYYGRKPQAIVAPGEDKIIIYKMKGSNAKLNYKIYPSFKKQVADLGQQAKQQGQRFDRLDQWGSNTGICVYILHHEGGMIAYYENQSNNMTLIEDVKFDLFGCKIEGVMSNSVQSRVAPGKSALINIIRTDNYQFRCNVVYFNYEIIGNSYYYY